MPVIIVTGCSSVEDEPVSPISIVQVYDNPLQPTELPDSIAMLAVSGANDFAFKLSALLAENAGYGNLIVSPFSVWLPLAALSNATDEANKGVLMDALGMSGMGDYINRATAHMLYDLTNDDTLMITNALFVDYNKMPQHDFAQAYMDYYRGTVMKVDFASPDAVDAVNQWGYENTNGLVEKMVNHP